MKGLRRTVKRLDIASLLSQYQQVVVLNKPTLAIMLDEIKMMNFKIRPLSGDVSIIRAMDSKLIEMVWNLGKLDQLYREKERFLKLKDRELFVKFFESMHEKFQKELGLVQVTVPEQVESAHALEMEVFRETPRRKKSN